jgi:hypothetical protein
VESGYLGKLKLGVGALKDAPFSLKALFLQFNMRLQS